MLSRHYNIKAMLAWLPIFGNTNNTNIIPIIIEAKTAQTIDNITIFAIFLFLSVLFMQVDKMDIETIPKTKAAIPAIMANKI